MNDASLYTGLDGNMDDNSGMFGNEKRDKETETLLQEQDRQIKELTPKLQTILDMIDIEIKSVMSIDRFITATEKSENMIQAELQASALYKNYLNGLKTKFTLALNETKK